MPRPSFTSEIVSTSTILPPPHPAWPALVNPHRFAEARRAIASDPAGLIAARGDKWGESAVHWVGMSDPGGWIDLISAGGDPNATDNLGRTPLDWVNDRLWMGAMAPHQRLGTPSRDRIRVATIKQAPAIWASGGRPGSGKSSLNPVQLWIEAGLWDLLSLAVSEPSFWQDWQEGSHALISWTSMADREGARELFDRILSVGLKVDQADDFGRSALWVAVDSWLESPSSAAAPRAAIEVLRANGADPDLDQGAGAPSLLPSGRGASLQLQTSIANALGM